MHRQLDAVLEPGDADDCHRSAGAGCEQSCGDRLWPAGGVDHVVEPDAVGDLHRQLAEVLRRRVDHVGHPEPLSLVPAGGHRIDADDPRRTGEPGALHGRDADAAQPNDGNRVAGRDLRRVEYRADTGLHSATEQAGDRRAGCRQGP